jgi:hypothetical protein
MMRSLLLAAAAALAAACGDGGDAGPDAAPATCEAYCDSILDACVGELAQFADRAQCLSVCAAWPAGAPGERSGNSRECRTYYAAAAISDATTYCVSAGPSGAGACGTACEGFCSVVTTACTGADAAYDSEQACLDACAGIDDTEPYDAADVSGDSLSCRLYHAAVALVDPATHCPHTQPVSAPCN